MLENLGSTLAIIMIVALGVSNYLLFKCSQYLSGCTITTFSTSKMPKIRKVIQQYKNSELHDVTAKKYIKWYLVTFRTFYLSLLLLVLLIVIMNV